MSGGLFLQLPLCFPLAFLALLRLLPVMLFHFVPPILSIYPLFALCTTRTSHQLCCPKERKSSEFCVESFADGNENAGEHGDGED